MIIDVVTLRDLDRPKVRPFSVTYWLEDGEQEGLVDAIDRHEAERIIQSRYNVDVAAYGTELPTGHDSKMHPADKSLCDWIDKQNQRS